VGKSLWFALLLLVASACGDPLFFAQVSEPKICIQAVNETVPAAPAGVGPAQVTWQGSFDLSQVPGNGDSDTTGTVTILSLEIDSTTDMSGVTQVAVDLPTIVTSGDYIDYTVPSPLADPNSILMTPTVPNVNLLSALTNGGTLPYGITLTGTPPTQAWQANVTACLSVNVEVNLLKASK